MCGGNGFCFRFRKSVKELLELEFFTEWGTSVKVEARRTNKPDIIQFDIKYDDKKRKDVHKKDEAIQFDFNVSKDDAEVIVKEMVRERTICCPFKESGGAKHLQ